MSEFEKMIKLEEYTEKRVAEAELVKVIDEEKGIAMMRGKDGVPFYMSTKGGPKQRTFGDFVEVKGEMTEGKRAIARAEVIENICAGIRLLADEHPEWMFIEKGSEVYHTVACKIVIPEPISKGE
jgi:hypothetical protein